MMLPVTEASVRQASGALAVNSSLLHSRQRGLCWRYRRPSAAQGKSRGSCSC